MFKKKEKTTTTTKTTEPAKPQKPGKKHSGIRDAVSGIRMGLYVGRKSDQTTEGAGNHTKESDYSIGIKITRKKTSKITPLQYNNFIEKETVSIVYLDELKNKQTFEQREWFEKMAKLYPGAQFGLIATDNKEWQKASDGPHKEGHKIKIYKDGKEIAHLDDFDKTEITRILDEYAPSPIKTGNNPTQHDASHDATTISDEYQTILNSEKETSTQAPVYEGPPSWWNPSDPSTNINFLPEQVEEWKRIAREEKQRQERKFPQIDSYEQYQELIKNDMLTVVDYSFPESFNSFKLTNAIYKMADESRYEKVKFIKIDPQLNTRAFAEAKFKKHPTVQIWKQGQELENIAGCQEEQLQELIFKHLI